MVRLSWRIPLLFCAAGQLLGSSYYTTRLDDPKAVYLTPADFAVHGDGIADDSGAIQAAIDRLQETNHQGVLFVPEGKYRLTKTVYVWTGIRLIGYGASRPVFILGENTPGFQEGEQKYMVHFVSSRPAEGKPIRDANPGTFYSGMSNIDIEIRAGNPAAIGIRFFVAQHSYLAHMEFRIGGGRAGLEDIGNEGDDLRFVGGDFGIITRKPSPGWPYLLIDSHFEGQRVAAIKAQEAGLTLIRDSFQNVPTAVSVNPDRAEELWARDCRFSDISGPAVVISNEGSACTEINMEGVACERVPVLARLRESGGEVAGPGPIYLVRSFTHGLHIADVGVDPKIDTTHDIVALNEAPPPVRSDVPDLPDRSGWVNVRELGVKGDGVSDDTAALRDAIAKHRTLYLPSGRYRVTDTITLGPDTVLIGLSPIATVIAIDDGTPAFQGPGTPKALLEAPSGAADIVTGIGLDTGGRNTRAVGARWMAGKDSLMNDVRFHGGHGTYRLDGNAFDISRSWEKIYNNTHTADPDSSRIWDSQYPSLWITDGGGGTFKDIWTPSTFAQAGLCISDTSTEGRMYAISVEHHVRNEVKLRNVSNWRIYDLQMEEERGESAAALPLEIDGCSNVAFANTYFYRVVSSTVPFPYAVKVSDSRDIRFRNFHCFSNSKAPFDVAILDQGHGVEVRSREFAILDLSGRPPAPQPARAGVILDAGARVEEMAGGFANICGAAVDPSGQPYFIDVRWQRIYRWSPSTRSLTLVSDAPLAPTQLVFDRAGDLIVVANAAKGTVYSFRPGDDESKFSFLSPVPAAPRPGLVAALPVDFWPRETDPGVPQFHYISPDGTTFIPAGGDFVDGRIQYGVNMSYVLHASALAPAVPGQPFYAGDDWGLKTFAWSVGADGTLSAPKLFAERGSAGTAVDIRGNVFIADDQVRVYDQAGELVDTIEVPKRPTGILFGGEDRRTLFILARSSLYSVRTRYPGR
jgi:hypothetical protein